MDLCAVIRCDIMNLATEASLDIFARVNEGFFTVSCLQEFLYFLCVYLVALFSSLKSTLSCKYGVIVVWALTSFPDPRLFWLFKEGPTAWYLKSCDHFPFQKMAGFLYILPETLFQR